jgi:hypothetical protein
MLLKPEEHIHRPTKKPEFDSTLHGQIKQYFSEEFNKELFDPQKLTKPINTIEVIYFIFCNA